MVSDKAVEYLRLKGYITMLKGNEEYELVQKKALELEVQEKSSPRLFYLMITYACQLRCTYCFEHAARSALRHHRSEGRT